MSVITTVQGTVDSAMIERVVLDSETMTGEVQFKVPKCGRPGHTCSHSCTAPLTPADFNNLDDWIIKTVEDELGM